MALEDRRIYQEACTRCSQCKFVPMPESKAFSGLCPSVDYGHFHAYSAGGKVITSYALLENKAAITSTLIDSVFACTMCGACDTACKTNLGENVEPLDTLYELRAHLAKEGHTPVALRQMVERLMAEGSHLGLRSARSRWAEGLAIKNAAHEPVEVLLHIGSSMAFDTQQWPQLKLLVDLLTWANVDFGIAFDDESDSGGLAFDLGSQAQAQTLARATQERVVQSGARVMVVACAQEYAAFKGIYPRLGVPLTSVSIVHSSEFIEALVRDGKLAMNSTAKRTVTYHDPCRLGRLSETYQPWGGEWQTVLNTIPVPATKRPVLYGNNGNYEAPRQLLGMAGIEVLEMQRNRQFAYCCGAGAGAAEAYGDMADQAALRRLEEAQATGANCLVTACAGCERHFAKVARAHGIEMEIVDVLTIVGEQFQEVRHVAV